MNLADRAAAVNRIGPHAQRYNVVVIAVIGQQVRAEQHPGTYPCSSGIIDSYPNDIIARINHAFGSSGCPGVFGIAEIIRAA